MHYQAQSNPLLTITLLDTREPGWEQMLPGKEAAEACLRNVIRGGCGKVSLYAPSGHQVHGIMTPPPHHLPGLASLPVNTDTAKTHLDSSSIFSENMVMLLQLRHNDLTLIPVEHGISLQKRPTVVSLLH